MEKVVVFLLFVFIQVPEAQGQADQIACTYRTGTRQYFATLDLNSEVYSNISRLSGVNSLSVGESTFDTQNGRYFINTNLGITIVDVSTGNILNTVTTPSPLRGMEYDPGRNQLIASYWTGTQQILTALDLNTYTLSNIKRLNGVNSLSVGESTFDTQNGRYFINTNLGITIVDVSTGNILNTVTTPNSLNGMEYDPGANQLIASYWTGSRQILTALDLDTYTFSNIKRLNGVTSLIVGESTFDVQNSRYFINTNLGITVVDVSTGNILQTIANPDNVVHIEYTGSPNALPIQLSNFKAELQDNDQVKLTWQTIREFNNELFQIEKSKNGRQWQTANKTFGAGNSLTPRRYIEIDPNPFPGITYYRLKQIDFDGKWSYSHTIFVRTGIRLLQSAPSVFPNPTHDQLVLRYEGLDPRSIQILSLRQENVSSKIDVTERSAEQIQINVSQLLPGLYIVKSNMKAILFSKQ